MRILAIDPGPVESAWVLWDTKKHDFIKPLSGRNKGLEQNNKVIGMLPFLADGDIDLVAIEMISSYGLSVGRSTLITCCVVGQIIQKCMDNNIPFKLYGRPTIKGQIGGRTDAEIRSSLRIRYGESRKGEKLEGVKNDIWSSLALAVALEENPALKEW